jgi:hypothetical protein
LIFFPPHLNFFAIGEIGVLQFKHCNVLFHTFMKKKKNHKMHFFKKIL